MIRIKNSTLLLALTLGLFACKAEVNKPQPVKAPKPAAAGKIPQFTIGHVGHDHQIALGVAALKPEMTQKACGFSLKENKFREVYDLIQGDKVMARFIVKKVGGGSNMPAAMEKGDLDIGFGGIPAVIKFIDKGNPFKILCPLNVDGDMIFVRPDFPANNWEEFVAYAKKSEKPLALGVKNIMSVAKLIFAQACADAGIADKIEYVNLKSNKNVIPTLKAKGTIIGAVTNEPVCSKAIVKKVAKKISLLADLPPAGKFAAHPCCCVCATEKMIKSHSDVLTAFTKLMKVATDEINKDKVAAAGMGAKWTGMAENIENASIPNIVYTINPDAAYKRGLEGWYKMMVKAKLYKKDLKDLKFADFFAKVHDLSFIQAAL